MIETAKVLNISGQDQPSQDKGDNLLFEQYDLDQLQRSICVFFYYNEFMENVIKIFAESAG